MSQQPFCKLVSERAVLESLVSNDINYEDISHVVISLKDELKKIIEHDARDALDSGKDRDELDALDICKKCSSPDLPEEQIPVCIDGDKFELALCDKTKMPLHQSADFAVFEILGTQRYLAHIAEAKLGEKRRAKPNFPKCIELKRKFDLLISRIEAFVPIGGLLFFIVPKFSFEGQRRRVRHWNEANEFSPRKLVCLCPRAFLDRFAVSCTEKPICEVPMSSVH